MLESRLQKPPRVIILGEANSGKTALANRLIGCNLLTADIVRNTQVPVVLRYAPSAAVEVRRADGSRQRIVEGTFAALTLDDKDMIDVGIPIECLRLLEIIDTPRATFSDDVKQRNSAFGAHIAIWCTVASQAWRASEIALWRAIGQRTWETNILCVTHADRLGKEDCAKVRRRLQAEAGHLFQSVIMSDGAERTHSADQAGFNPAPACDDDILACVTSAAAAVQSKRCRRAGQVVQHFLEKLDIAT